MRVSSKVTKWKLNLGRPFSLIFLLIEMILWWCLYFSIISNTGFIQRSVFMEFSLGILRFWTTLLRQSLNVSAISVSQLRISPFSVRFIITLTVILSEKSGFAEFQNFLLLVISFGSKFEKYRFLAFRKRVTHKLHCFL